MDESCEDEPWSRPTLPGFTLCRRRGSLGLAAASCFL